MRLTLNASASVLSQTAPNADHKRVLLVDRQPLVREWLAYVLSQESDLIVCGQAADASAALRDIVALGPHAIIMDLTLEDGSGLDAIEHIAGRSPQTAVLVLSTRDEPHYAIRLLRAGARGYISKTEPTRKIIAALRRVLHGKVYLSPATAQCLIGGRPRGPGVCDAPSVETLSDRELEVFAMTGRGLGTRRIADLLHLSPKTIQAYHGRIKDKLQLRDANELMREAICWSERTGRRPHTAPPARANHDIG
jgi:DNA-binding NarL/FixJ family response regulator